MKQQTKIIFIPYILLIALTLVTGFLQSEAITHLSRKPLLIMIIAVAKVFILANFFMELRHAHRFWLFALVFMGVAIATGIIAFKGGF